MVFHELQSLINRLASHPCVHPNTRIELRTLVQHHHHSAASGHAASGAEIADEYVEEDFETTALDSITATSGVLTLS